MEAVLYEPQTILLESIKPNKFSGFYTVRLCELSDMKRLTSTGRYFKEKQGSTQMFCIPASALQESNSRYSCCEWHMYTVTFTILAILVTALSHFLRVMPEVTLDSCTRSSHFCIFNVDKGRPGYKTCFTGEAYTLPLESFID